MRYLRMDESKYFTSEEILKKFYIASSTLRGWLKTKPEFPKPIRLGRRNLWLKTEIAQYESYIESLREK